MGDKLDQLIEAIQETQGEQSLRDFAATLNVSYSVLSMIYRGKRAPGIKVLSALRSTYPNEMGGAIDLFLSQDVTTVNVGGHNNDALEEEPA